MKPKASKKSRKSLKSHIEFVAFLHPRSDVYEQLSKPVINDSGVKLITGEIGNIDCLATTYEGLSHT
jgi:hypothetical protein